MKGYVYKIANEDENIVYIGCTTLSLSKLWQTYKTSYKRWVSDKGKKCSIYQHFHEVGIENFTMTMISEHEVEDHSQLREFEQLLISKTDCVNQVRAYRTKDEKKEYCCKYEADNKETLHSKRQAWEQNNKDHLQEYHKKYRETNKEVLSAYRKEKIQCECGSSYSRNDRARHQRTQKHHSLMEQQA